MSRNKGEICLSFFKRGIIIDGFKKMKRAETKHGKKRKKQFSPREMKKDFAQRDVGRT